MENSKVTRTIINLRRGLCYHHDWNIIRKKWTNLTCRNLARFPDRVYVDLYSAFLRKAPQMRSDMENAEHTVLPANYTMPAFTPQPQNITALWLVLILPSHGG